MALTLPANFKNDIQGRDTNLVPLVQIGYYDYFGGTTPIDSFNWISTNQIDVYGGVMSLPILLNIPSLKESIDIEKRNYKISSINLDISNLPYEGKRFSERIDDSLINTECRILWVSPSSSIPLNEYHFAEDGEHPEEYRAYFQVFNGIIRRYTHDDEKVRLVVEDRSQATLHKELPQTILDPNDPSVPDKYKNKPIPMVYGHVDRSPCVISSGVVDDSNQTNDSIKIIADSDNSNSVIRDEGLLPYSTTDNSTTGGLYIYRGDYVSVPKYSENNPIDNNQYSISNNMITVYRNFDGDYESTNYPGGDQIECILIRYPSTLDIGYRSQGYLSPEGMINPTGNQYEYQETTFNNTDTVSRYINKKPILRFDPIGIEDEVSCTHRIGRRWGYYAEESNSGATAFNIKERLTHASGLIVDQIYTEYSFGNWLNKDNLTVPQSLSSIYQVVDSEVFGENLEYLLADDIVGYSVHPLDVFTPAGGSYTWQGYIDTYIYLYQRPLVGKFFNSDFYADVNGRITDAKAWEVIAAENGIGVTELGMDAISNPATGLYANWNYDFTVDKKINSKKLIENIASASPYIPRFDNMGNFKFDVIQKEYASTSSIDHTIREADVISFTFKRTPIEDVCTYIEFDYEWDYARGAFNKKTKLDIQDWACADINGNHETFPYYGLPDDHSESTLIIDDDRGKYIRNKDTAERFVCWMMSWYCNQHLIINVKLPLKYMFIEIGDIVDFDDLLGDVAPYGINYKTGTAVGMPTFQDTFKYFMVVSTNKKLDSVDIEVIQMHRLHDHVVE